MSTSIAVGHIVGALILSMALGIGWLVLAGWDNRRHEKLLLQEFCLKFRVPPEQIDNEPYSSKFIAYMTDKFSDEQLKNRISDLCGIIVFCWNILATIVQWAIPLWVIWITVSESKDNAVYIWAIFPVWLFFTVVGVLFVYACRILTGRFPGQAKKARKALVKLIQERGRHDSGESALGEFN